MAIKIDKFPYKGKLFRCQGISVAGCPSSATATAIRITDSAVYRSPGRRDPIHNHFYHQTMYILSGSFECWKFRPQTDQLAEKVACPAGTSVYIPSMEPHGMRNLSLTEEATFLCCICNVYEEGGAV
jgi:uncharacterized RmlC-like cupin family protein